MRYLIASFHNGNLPAEMLAAQRRVCAHHGIPLLQWHSHLTHGEAMDECLAAHPDWEVACLMDADAFCRDPLWLWEVMRMMCASEPQSAASALSPDSIAMVGGAHNANHRHGAMDYASPACCITGRQYYELARGHGCPGFQVFDPQDGKAPKDVGQHLSDTLREAGFRVGLLQPLSVRVPKWRLMNGDMFGNGTDYGCFYHEFESRFGESPSREFVSKVQEELLQPGSGFRLPASEMSWMRR